MVGALLLIFNDPMDRLLPVPVPALVPGPTTTWDPAVVLADGRLDWDAAGEAGRAVVPGSPHDAWPALQAALTAAGLPRESPQSSLADLRTGRSSQPDQTEKDARARAAQPVLDLLAAASAESVWAVPPEARRGFVGKQSMAHEALRQLVAAAAEASPERLADPQDRLRAAARLLPLIRVAAGCEDLGGAIIAHDADSSFWRCLLRALIAAPGDPAVREAVVALRGRHAMPSMPAAFRRTRLATLADAIDLVNQALKDGDGRMRRNRPPDINHVLALLNRWHDGFAGVLPADPADGRSLAVLAARLDDLPHADIMDEPERPLAERMIFRTAVDERRRETAMMIATLYETICWAQGVGATRRARSAMLHRAAVHAMLEVPPRQSAATTATELTAALPSMPETGGNVVFRADGSSVHVELLLDGKTETIATIKATGP